MDEINDFFDFSKDFERISAPSGLISSNPAALARDDDIYKKPAKRELSSDDYARDAIAKEQQMMNMYEEDADDEPSASKRGNVSNVSRMDGLEAFSDDEEMGATNFQRDAVYDIFQFDFDRDETLPIFQSRDEIISNIRASPVVVIEGDTGCGKTTQVPQYILDDCFRRNEYCNIVVTQPRRIAAMSIANRVADERKWEVGSVIGYQVGLHAFSSEHTRLLYCTTGVLLQKLVKEKGLRPYTHIILDEVHERDQDMDFLLILVRRLLATNSTRTKVVLMSATINTKEFTNYFKIRNMPAPAVKADCRRNYQVREYYLEDLKRINANDFDVDYTTPGIDKEMYTIALKLVIVIDNIEKQEMRSSGSTANSSRNSILFFLPGINEIDTMYKNITSICNEENQINLYPIRLHSMISPDEQMLVFKRQAPGARKVILATNIAESSITVPDVKYVIDFCLTKSLITDTNTNFTSLQLHWASKANCRQRSGRAGRVMNGRVYRLVTSFFYKNLMPEFGVPEMLRSPLEMLVLKAKLLDMGPPPSILALAMNPPNLTDIKNTILHLKEAGAFYTLMNDGQYNTEDGEITYLGRIMAALPLDIHITRLIVLGYMFSMLDEAIIIAAGLSVRCIFVELPNKLKNEVDLYTQKLIWADGSGSDLVGILKAYNTWLGMREQFHRSGEGEKSWAVRFCLNLRQINEMHLLIEELRQRLQHFKIKEYNATQGVQWLEREKIIVLKIIIAGAFYPNYFTRSNLNDVTRERSIYQKLCSNDPCNTVYMTGFNTRNIGPLYVDAIKDLFKSVNIHPQNIEVRFQPASEHVFVIFKPDPDEENEHPHNRLIVPGRVRREIYQAIRMRMSRIPMVIRVMEPKVAMKYVKDHKIGRISSDGAWYPTEKSDSDLYRTVLPNVLDKTLRGHISNVVNCSKFYFQPLTVADDMRQITTNLNTDAAKKLFFMSPAAISKGMHLAAPLDDIYHRAQVLSVISSGQHKVSFKVLFIDFGKCEVIAFEELRKYALSATYLLNVPPQCFECRLATVEPSYIQSVNGKWDFESIDLLTRAADAGIVEIEVYSLVSGIANVFVEHNNSTINQLLIDLGYARKAEENYMSKMDHDQRDRTQSAAKRLSSEEQSHINDEYMQTQNIAQHMDINAPPEELCVKTNVLRGPFSPLETKVYSALRIGAWKSVNIDRQSVNSVLIDTDPHDMHERLMVAATVTEDSRNQNLTARATTLMPNIHGFGALMTMLFCPRMQIKRNKSNTKYISILAGLGHDAETYEPLYEEHDVVMNLDVDILKDDIELINHLRYSMDTMLLTRAEEDEPPLTQEVRTNLQAKIKDITIRLLNKNRKYIETNVDGQGHVWQREPADDLMEMDNLYGTRSLFPVHSGLRLYNEKYEHIHSLKDHCRELHRISNLENFVQPITCLLCNLNFESSIQLRIHLLCQLHRDREQQIRFQSR